MGVGERQSLLWDGIFFSWVSICFTEAARLAFQKHGLIVSQLGKIS